MKAHHGGFGLIEMLVVIGAISILVGIALPAYNGYREKAKIAEAMKVLKDIEVAIITLAADSGEWPGHQNLGVINNGASNEIEDLNAASSGLVATDNNFSNWNGPYMNAVPLDPWGTHYFLDTDYSIPSTGPDFVVLGSYGPNGQGNNNYDDDDVRLILLLK